ncbi:hypothetical protein ACJZL3_04995 [Wolbachia endosymbiont of Rhagoletis cingulata]|uniref:hypothetical protein n=1 Tax=Wolbachia endosymbiont of Rhagoletis cingulata TaxID=1220542 RepID=UPI003AF3B17D
MTKFCSQSLEIAQKKLDKDQESADLKEIVNLLDDKINSHVETNDEIDDNPETCFSDATIDNQLARSPNF